MMQKDLRSYIFLALKGNLEFIRDRLRFFKTTLEVKTRDTKTYAIYLAARMGHFPVVEFLFPHISNVNEPDDRRWRLADYVIAGDFRDGIYPPKHPKRKEFLRQVIDWGAQPSRWIND